MSERQDGYAERVIVAFRGRFVSECLRSAAITSAHTLHAYARISSLSDPFPQVAMLAKARDVSRKLSAAASDSWLHPESFELACPTASPTLSVQC